MGLPQPRGAAVRPTLYRDAAFTDARSPILQRGVSVLVDGGTITWMGPSDDEPDPGTARVVDAGGATIVPGMVDAHSHVTMPGGSHWIDRGFDDTAELLAVAEDNARLALDAGVRWFRDVGSPMREIDGRERAVALDVRDRWRTRGREVPYLRAAGAWVSRDGTLPGGLAVEARDADEFLAGAMRQLDDGADLVKLYLDGPDPDTAPWTAAETSRVVREAHARGARVTAHATRLPGARVCAEAGVDAIEHGFELDGDIVATMASRGTVLVATLAVMSSWRTFGDTTTIDRFVEPEARARIEARREAGFESVRLAHHAGVPIAAGTDFGGGSLRANQLAWEVESLVEAGLAPWEALAAATWRGGDLLGEPDAGRIRIGGPADFFLVHGDPLSDPSALWRVWKVA
jgi:imidazolonepropionase-like amidohydrolase